MGHWRFWSIASDELERGTTSVKGRNGVKRGRDPSTTSYIHICIKSSGLAKVKLIATILKTPKIKKKALKIIRRG